jgi:Zinc carboxypeptidase
MTLKLKRIFVAVTLSLLIAIAPASAQVAIPTPEQFFGFKMGTAGELARYPKELEYFQLLAKQSPRVRYEVLGKTTLGNPYVLVTISSPENLKQLNQLIEINRKLADPRTTSEAEAAKLVEEGRPFYLLYATIHSTEIGNSQSIVDVAHRLATGSTPAITQILDNTVLLLVPSQNPDGQYLVIDHWYKTKGTPFNRIYPDLYHVYAGHDDNRDWFMFTQKETRLMVEKVQNAYKPVLTHDMHQQGPVNARIFVPPFDEPYDVNFHPLLAQEQRQIGAALSTALVAEGKEGVTWAGEGYDLWAAARQYMIYHGQVRILTEIASANLADPFVNPAGKDKPLGPQEPRLNFPKPYSRPDWTLAQIVDYGTSAVFAGLTEVAKYRTEWLSNFYKVHRDWTSWKGSPYAFVVPAKQRDPYATYHLLDILRTGAVEIHQASAPFDIDGRRYDAGSYVIKLAQPYGGFAKTLLEKQVYPDLRLFPGGPPKPPYDVTTQTLGLLMGVEVTPVAKPFEASLDLVKTLTPRQTPLPDAAKWAYAFGPESNAGFVAVARLQKANVPIFRIAKPAAIGDRKLTPGTWLVPPTADAHRVLAEVAHETGLEVFAANDSIDGVPAFRLKPNTRIGLWRGVGNASGGWMKWLFEQYGFNHEVVKADDFKDDLSAHYDTIVLPGGITKNTIVNGVDPARLGPEWAWAAGVGDAGWQKLAQWVKNGGTLVAIGNSVEAARDLLNLPIAKVLPEARRRREAPGAGGGSEATAANGQTAETAVTAALKDAFTSPARLDTVLRNRVIEPEAQFYCPGSLLQNDFDPAHPIAFGLPASWPVFFESDQAYRLTPSFEIHPEVVARYPAQGPILTSGWLLGEDLLRDQSNIVAFRVGKGYVVTLASEVAFRAQPEATFKLVFNAMFHGPSTSTTTNDLTTATTAPTSRTQSAR